MKFLTDQEIMINLIDKLRAEHAELARQLESSFVQSPHYFESDIATVALPLRHLADVVDFIPVDCLPEDIQSSCLQRKINFIGGRLCAESALKKLGFGHGVVNRQSSGAPLWPTGTIGSITHTNEIACAAVTLTGHAVSLGIDSELIFSDTQLQDVRSLCCTGTEIRTLFNSSNSNLIGTIIFSAKEAVYKSIHPFLNRFVDFSEIEVTSINWRLSTLDLHPVAEGDVSQVLGNCRAYFSIENSLVHTSVQMDGATLNCH